MFLTSMSEDDLLTPSNNKFAVWNVARVIFAMEFLNFCNYALV